jgi:hypothetical protein
MNKATFQNWLRDRFADFEADQIEAKTMGQDIEADTLAALKWHTYEIIQTINSGKFDR